jgi:hypothetical protein
MRLSLADSQRESKDCHEGTKDTKKKRNMGGKSKSLNHGEHGGRARSVVLVDKEARAMREQPPVTRASETSSFRDVTSNRRRPCALNRTAA